MNVNAFIQAWLVVSMLIWRIRGASRLSPKTRLENQTNCRAPRLLKEPEDVTER